MPRPLRGAEDRLDRHLARLEIGCEPALVPHRGREAPLAEELLQLVVGLRRDPEGFGEALRSGWDEHELLQVDRVVGVDAAVDHVEQGHGQRRGVLAAEMAVERDPGVGRGRLRVRQRDAQDRVRSEPALASRPVELDQSAIESRLVVGLQPRNGGSDLAVHVPNGPRHRLAAVGRTAVAQLDRLVHTGRGA